jgi:hypothetical protein
MADDEKIKVCPCCDAAFSCSRYNCWCSKFPPVMPMIEGSECYCPECLGKLINDKLKG